jgi:hypothetical protein
MVNCRIASLIALSAFSASTWPITAAGVPLMRTIAQVASFESLATSQHLWQIGADEIAAAVQLVRVTLWAVPVQLLFPLHHVASAPVLLDQLGDSVAALALAACALDAQHVEFAFKVAERQVAAHGSALRRVGSPSEDVDAYAG